MQTWITDYDFYKSASNLKLEHLRATIYENIHGLASLLGCVDDLILSDKAKNKAKKLINKPQCKLWIGYEKELLYYIKIHLEEWFKREFTSIINLKNLEILSSYISFNEEYIKIPNWITDKLIQTHRSVLIQKEIEKEMQIYKITPYKMLDENEKEYEAKVKNYLNKLKNNYHYRNLFPNTSINLSMKYDWRKDNA